MGYFIVSWWITQCVRLSSKTILNRMSYEFVTSFYFFLLPSVSNKKSFLCFLASQSLISLFLTGSHMTGDIGMDQLGTPVKFNVSGCS